MNIKFPNPGFRWTYHPVVDMGIASLMVFAGRRTPNELTAMDLEDFATYAEAAYFSPQLESALTVLFTVNFVSPNSPPEARRRFIGDLLRLFNAAPDVNMGACAFCGAPAIRLTHRDLVPLLSGRQTINFFPSGQLGLPICSKCLIAVQAVSISAPISSGKAMVIACDDPQVTVEFVRRWQREIRDAIQLSLETGRKQRSFTRALTKTVKTLAEIQSYVREEPISITLYYFSNSGQGPDIQIYSLSPVSIYFLKRVIAAYGSGVWHELVNSQWALSSNSMALGQMEHDFSRNFLYEDLYGLPERSPQFLRRYFRKNILSLLEKGSDPTDLWNLIVTFLDEMAIVDPPRIDAAKDVADRLAKAIVDKNDGKLWQAIYSADGYRAVRSSLIRINETGADRKASPLFTSDDLMIFEDTAGLKRNDWRVIWDLVVMRMTSALFKRKWFDERQDILGETDQYNMGQGRKWHS